MKPNYASKVHEDLDRLLDVGFIVPIGLMKWLSPIVIVPSKNGKLHICMDYMRLNFLTKKDPCAFPFIDEFLGLVEGKELYSFLDGFSGYNQVKIKAEDKEKIAFMIKWGPFVFMVMAFGLCNALATFQQTIIKTFWEYIGEFMQVFLDDFIVYGDAATHLHLLAKCFHRFQEVGINLNSKKYSFDVQSRILLGHIVCRKGC
jgi:hypothetical protein